MRVLVFGISGDKRGGINSFLLSMNSHMSKDTIFDYVIEGPNSVNSEEIQSLGGKEYHIPYFIQHPIDYHKQIKNILTQNKQNYICAYFNLYSDVHLREVQIAKRIGYKIVLHAHNNGVEKGFVYQLIHRINRVRFRRIEALRLTNSRPSACFIFGNKLANEAINVPCAIDVQKYRFSFEERQRIRDELNVSYNFVVGFSGRLQPQKNPLFLLDIFDSVQKRREDAILLICGDGFLREKLEKAVDEKGLNNRVVFLGNRNDMDKIYQSFDCFVLPSLFEGLGIVLVEAQACGLACIASDQVIPREAKLLDNFRFVGLSETPDEWANVILASKSENREDAFKVVLESPYNIEKESGRLERLLIYGKDRD